MIRSVLLVVALAASGPCVAGVGSGSVTVNITLSQPGAPAPGGAVSPGSAAGNGPGTCISDTLSEATGAVVRVACTSDQFVGISPQPGRRFAGTHGGAYRHYFGPGFGSIYRTEYTASRGAGTITSFRVYSVEGADGPLDLLVSF